MKLITLDFETFYDREYSLSKISTEEYVRDPRFEVIGLGIKERNSAPRWYTDGEVERVLKEYDWSKCAVLAHNTMFDGAILSWRYGVKPRLWLDTLSMARPLHGSEVGGSLAALAKHYGLGEKGTEVVNALGKRRKDFSKAELDKYGDYCINDVQLTHALFHILGGKVDKKELEVIDLTLRMFVEPVLELDGELLRTHLTEVIERQERLISLAQADRATLMSNDKFAAKLYELGVEPPIKISPTTGKPALALAKTDEAFKALAEHSDERVQALVAARLGNKSTIEQTRTERFLEISLRGTLPIPLKYYAAHTGRWGGTDKLNLQNLPSRGANKNKLKRAIKAPDGYVMIDCDSSQIEARTVAWLAEQNDLVEAFANKEDVYKLMASQIYNVPVDEVTQEQRFVGKTTILGAGYGMGAAKFQVQLKVFGVDVALDECKRIINVYRDKAFKIKELWGMAQRGLTYMLMDERMWLGREGVLLVDGAKGILLPSGYYLKYEGLSATSTDKGEQFTYISKKGKTGVETKIYGGKVIENCIAEGTLVLTDRGWVPIQFITPKDKVHDGVEFVNHGGLLFKSVQPCISIDGVYMTPDHEVLTDDGWKAASQDPRPFRPDIRSVDRSANTFQRRGESTLGIPMSMRDGVRKAWGRRHKRSSSWGHPQLWVYDERVNFYKKQNPRHEQTSGVCGLAVHARSMPTPIASGLEKLWGAGDNCLRSLAGKIREFLGGYGSYVCSWFGFGPQGQQRPVLAGELSLGFSSGQFDEQTKHRASNRCSGVKQENRYPTYHALLSIKTWVAFREVNYPTKSEKPVYDVLNAGPRSRFVVKGNTGPFIVHNCCQALARCVISEQMLMLSKKYRPVLTVHDAIAVIAPKAEAEEARAYVEQCMRWVPEWAKGLPLDCESGMAERYGDC